MRYFVCFSVILRVAPAPHVMGWHTNGSIYFNSTTLFTLFRQELVILDLFLLHLPFNPFLFKYCMQMWENVPKRVPGTVSSEVTQFLCLTRVYISLKLFFCTYTYHPVR